MGSASKTEVGLLAVVFCSFMVIGILLLMPGSVIDPDTPKFAVIAEGYVKIDTTAAVVASCPVWIYDTPTPNINDPAYDAATTDANGKYTLTVMVTPGQKLYVQVRKAASATSDPYITPLIPITIPAAAEAGDTVPVGTIYVRDVSAATPTIAATDQSGNSVSDNTQYYVNTTDSKVVVTISALTADTWFGSEDYTDYLTGLDFWGAVVVWKGTKSQPFVGYDLIIQDPTNIWYVWRLDPFRNLAGDTSDDSSFITMVFNGAAIADATVLINAYDCVDYKQMLNGVFTSSALTVGTLTIKVA